MSVRVTDVKTFITAPGVCDLIVVEVETNQPGLYGFYRKGKSYGQT